jgi:uncharacterized membrane protein YhaH (DUF805 family)
MIERTAKDWMLLPLRRYAEFSGRSPRAEYWWFILFSILISIPATIVDLMMGAQIVGSLVSLGLFLPSLAVAVRRLHDIDRSGWWMLLPVPAVFATCVLVGAEFLLNPEAANAVIGGNPLLWAALAAAAITSLLLFVWYCTRGTAGPNRFGEDPLQPAENPTRYF